MTKPLRRGMLAAAAATIGFLIVAGIGLATMGSGIIAAPVQARGTIGPTDGPNLVVNSKTGVHLKALGSTDLVTQQIRIGPGGHTGWHSHPGPVLVTVKSGSLQLIYANDEGCQGVVYETGDSFVDRGDENVHIARASPFDGVELWATYFVPGGNRALRSGSTHPIRERAARRPYFLSLCSPALGAPDDAKRGERIYDPLA